jgi:hypothetical protein
MRRGAEEGNQEELEAGLQFEIDWLLKKGIEVF